MKYCAECGTKLVEKPDREGNLVPYCETCQKFRFPVFNTAIIAIILNPAQDKVLLIQQYGKKDNILVAGYVNKGENLEHALAREIREELGREVIAYQYMSSQYFASSQTLMCAYVCQIDEEDLSQINYEVDRAAWFDFVDAVKKIKDKSLAQKFLIEALEDLKMHHFEI